jgi:phage anti-repressor protein
MSVSLYRVVEVKSGWSRWTRHRVIAEARAEQQASVFCKAQIVYWFLHNNPLAPL